MNKKSKYALMMIRLKYQDSKEEGEIDSSYKDWEIGETCGEA